MSLLTLTEEDFEKAIGRVRVSPLVQTPPFFTFNRFTAICEEFHSGLILPPH